jgi:Uma2 family endonuclease
MGQGYDPQLYSVEEYLEREKESLDKHEYYNGQIYLMSGGSALISANTISSLGIALREKACQVYSSDALLKVKTQSHYTYANATVVCRRPEYEQLRKNRMLINPALIVLENLEISLTLEDIYRNVEFEDEANSCLT